MEADEQRLYRRGGMALVAGGVLLLLAISSQFGFIAPPLAATAPATLDRVNVYPPVVIFNALAAIAFMGGYVVLGVALSKSDAFPAWAGLLVSVGAVAHLIGFGVSQLAAHTLWFVAVLGGAALGAGLALCGARMAGSTAAPLPAQPSH